MTNSKSANQRIADDIREMIQNRSLSLEEPLPSENELARQYGVSRTTVQKALSLLVSDHLIYSIPGKGYYINQVEGHIYSFEYTDFENSEVMILGMKLISPPPEVIYNLHIHPKDKVPEIRRIISQNGKPVAVDLKYVPYSPGIPLGEMKNNYNNFYGLMPSDIPERSLQKNLNIYINTADDDIYEKLNIDEGSDILIIEELIKTDDDEPLAWGKTYCNPMYFSLNAARFK